MKPIIIPSRYNYIAVFLSLTCNLSCSYCTNRFNEFRYEKGSLFGAEWVRGLNRIMSRPDLPLTLQGGEPSIHPDFIYVLNHIKHELNTNLLKNTRFDIDQFMQHVDQRRSAENIL